MVQPKGKIKDEENYRSRVSGMDAAVALQRKKTIKFLCIVDFQLSKQGIFFITLTQKAVAKILPQLFSLLYRTKSAKAVTDFQSAFY